MNDKPVRPGFVVAEHNHDTTHMMEMKAEEHARFLGAAVYDRICVPGVYDMPIAIRKLLKKPGIGAFFTTDSAGGVANLDLSLKINKPVALGISELGMTQYLSGSIECSKRAVESAVKMVWRLSE